ncbi:unnamed protein product [Periconia digitata]|uniref:Uncharacterized protein n=1 Tax=Periconia digitata TaxID=1303443 RepID=A0A9W4U7M9_9PLEO|nr:unnamed protein product [Periconia digitata]
MQFTKDLVTDAVTRAAPFISNWPHHFNTIHDAEEFVRGSLERSMFRYGTAPSFPTYVNAEVMRRTHRHIALQAYQAKLFTLDQLPESKRVLATAVDEGVKLAYETVKWYPRSFAHINEARNYVRCICRGIGLRYILVDGVHPLQVALYIHYHTAIQAWRARKFDLEESPSMPDKHRQMEARGPATRIPSRDPQFPIYSRARQLAATEQAMANPNSSSSSPWPSANDTKGDGELLNMSPVRNDFAQEDLMSFSPVQEPHSSNDNNLDSREMSEDDLSFLDELEF